MLGWRLDFIIIGIGLLAIIYTVTGGSAAVNLTQKWQMAVIFGGMITAFVILLGKLPDHAVAIAGAMGKLQAVDYNPDLKQRYTIWSGVLGGFFLSLSYFGTDQSQVQRYIGGAALREGRLGLMFNAVLKIPMQFFIVMLGALLFVFYQFQPDTPLVFNRAAWQQAAQGPHGAEFRTFEEKHAALHADKLAKIRTWADTRAGGNAAAETVARAELRQAQQASDSLRSQARDALQAAAPETRKTRDSDFVFVTFILTQLPHGVIGLLIAVMFASALSSKSSELNALGTTTTVDLWRNLRPLAAHDERRNVVVAKRFTAMWGLFAISFALFVSFAENLIEALNIVASIFYPTLLGIFIVAFFFKKVGGSAVFWAAIAAQLVVLAIFSAGKVWPAHEIGYLWLNPIGCAACVVFALGLQAVLPRKAAN